MEMWKTAAPPMENRYSRPDGKAASFPTDRKHRFPQLRPLTVYTHSHSAYYCGYYMILVYRKGKENKKAGASPSVQTEGGAPNSIS